MQETIMIHTTSTSFCSAEVAMDEYVYIKHEVSKNGLTWGVYTQEGVRIAETDSRDAALIFIKQNNLKAAQLQ